MRLDTRAGGGKPGSEAAAGLGRRESWPAASSGVGRPARLVVAAPATPSVAGAAWSPATAVTRPPACPACPEWEALHRPSPRRTRVEAAVAVAVAVVTAIAARG